MKLSRLLIIGLSALMIIACRRDGCTDQTAVNYDKKAKNDDGSCIYENGNPNNPNNPNQTLPVNLTGTEDTDITIKYIGNSPNQVQYYIDGTWTINAEVTIEPGVRIEMRSGAAISINEDGSLNAIGTTSMPIRISGKQPQKGYWDYMLFSSSNNPNNKLINCTISDGGTGSWGEGMITLYGNSQVTIQHTSLKNASKYGLHLKNGTSIPNFKNNSFDNCGEEPLAVNNIYAIKDIENSISFGTNNGQNGSKNRIYVGGSTYSNSLNLKDFGTPYYFKGNFDIQGGVTTVDDGVNIIFGPGSILKVSSSGGLNFAGTSTNKIILKGEQSAKGWWGYLLIDSNHPQNNLSYVDISDGSNGSWGSGMISVTNNSLLNMDNTHIFNGSDLALDVKSSATFVDNGGNSWSDCTNGGGELP